MNFTCLETMNGMGGGGGGEIDGSNELFNKQGGLFLETRGGVVGGGGSKGVLQLYC